MDGPVAVTPKTTEYSAWQITQDNIHRIARWCGAKVMGSNLPGGRPSHLVLFGNSGEDDAYAEVGDWVVRGFNNHFFVAPAEWFDRTYEVKHVLPYRVEVAYEVYSASEAWWVIRVPVLDLVTQAETWEEVGEMATDVIACHLGCAVEAVAMEVHVVSS
jgi:predicted RNase H-like HicB family nuclease